MADIKNIVMNKYNTTYLPYASIENEKDAQLFKQYMISGFKKLQSLKDKHKGKPALIMGLGPSLFEIDKGKYSDNIKLTCNHFHKVPDFFKNMKPHYWCAANSYDELKDPFSYCMENDIQSLITIPIRKEFIRLLKISRDQGKMHLVYPWMWEQKIFQSLLAEKYFIKKTYSHCNTITNHMIAYALWMGCNPINVTGFDLSHNEALKVHGSTHAGFTDDRLENDDSIHGSGALDNPKMRKQIISDLKYLCFVANKNNITINNMSHIANRLPKILS